MAIMSMMKVTDHFRVKETNIRPLKSGDRNALENILKGTGNFNDEEINVAMELIDITINNSGQKDYIVDVFEDNGSAAGYICYGRRPMTAGTYDLYWIAVNPMIHGKGIGSRLISNMEKELVKQDARLVLIETSGKPDYEGERAFYEKNGYAIQTIIKDFYRYGDDLYIYHKYL